MKAEESMPESIMAKRKEYFLAKEKKMLENQAKWKEERKAKVSLEKPVVESFVCSCGNTINITKKNSTERKCFGCNKHYIKEQGTWNYTGITTTKYDVEPKQERFVKKQNKPLTFGDIVVKMRRKK